MTDQALSEQTHFIPRDLLAKYFGRDPRLLRAFENQALAVMENQEGLAAATETFETAAIVSLSPNDAFQNEYVLGDGDGTNIVATPGAVRVNVDATVARVAAYAVTFQPPGVVTLGLPVRGTLISDVEPATLNQKTLNTPTLNAPRITGLVNAVDDAAAAGLGVPVNGIYANAGALRVRLV